MARAEFQELIDKLIAEGDLVQHGEHKDFLWEFTGNALYKMNIDDRDYDYYKTWKTASGAVKWYLTQKFKN